MVVLSVGAFFYFYRLQPANEATPLRQEATEGQAGGDSVQDLVKEDLVVGTGTEAIPGKKVTVHYTGTLTSGEKFDSSLDRGQPFTFNLGSGQVIQGWDIGVAGMKVGGKRKLTIPPHLGYGERSPGAAIPPNATLLFEVELLKVE
ncbi:MAG: FKBP-type peptidylprolyl cis-trans isomerase [Microgenomates group bacterium Gr01-1014_5]|nr:MAG: FKBP-type peptidylprolyl cis-trans isomerase [Microgenomates group bacterium Gr01-1014_5]